MRGIAGSRLRLGAGTRSKQSRARVALMRLLRGSRKNLEGITRCFRWCISDACPYRCNGALDFQSRMCCTGAANKLALRSGAVDSRDMIESLGTFVYVSFSFFLSFLNIGSAARSDEVKNESWV